MGCLVIYGHTCHSIVVMSSGVEVNPTLNLDTMMKAKLSSVKALTGGIASLFKANKVTALYGHGSIKSANEVSVSIICL